MTELNETKRKERLKKKYAKKKYERSDTSSFLRGLEYKGKKIQNVWKERGTRIRWIENTDGTEIKSNTATVAALSRIKGTQLQIEKFKNASRPEKRRMILASIERQAALTPSTKRKFKTIGERVAGRVKGAPKFKFIYYKGRRVPIPEKYWDERKLLKKKKKYRRKKK